MIIAFHVLRRFQTIAFLFAHINCELVQGLDKWLPQNHSLFVVKKTLFSRKRCVSGHGLQPLGAGAGGAGAAKGAAGEFPLMTFLCVSSLVFLAPASAPIACKDAINVPV